VASIVNATPEPPPDQINFRSSRPLCIKAISESGSTFRTTCHFSCSRVGGRGYIIQVIARFSPRTGRDVMRAWQHRGGPLVYRRWCPTRPPLHTGAAPRDCSSTAGDASRDCSSTAGDASRDCSSTAGDASRDCSSTAGDASRDCSSAAGDASRDCPSAAGDASRDCPSTAGDASRDCPSTAGDASRDCPSTTGDARKKQPGESYGKVIL
jgi:hypothetical protein